MIWKSLLASYDPPFDAHFHSYDTVYDSCTHALPSLSSIQRRRHAVTTAIPRTCRAAHEENVQVLYDATHFGLVLFAGRARPGTLFACDNEGEDVEMAGNIESRNCLGPVADCRLFERMSNVSLVLSPGENPILWLFCRRLRGLVDALQKGRNLRKLYIKFDLSLSMLAKPRRQGEFGMAVLGCLLLFKSTARARRDVRVFATTTDLSLSTGASWDFVMGRGLERNVVEQLQYDLSFPRQLLAALPDEKELAVPADCLGRGRVLGGCYGPLQQSGFESSALWDTKALVLMESLEWMKVPAWMDNRALRVVRGWLFKYIGLPLMVVAVLPEMLLRLLYDILMSMIVDGQRW